MKRIKYKVKYGFDKNEYISIDTDELVKAFLSFLTGNRVILDGVALRGKDIIRIEPDWNNFGGYMKGYIMQPRDYECSDITKRKTDRARELGVIAKDIASDILTISDKGEQKILLSKSFRELVELYTPKKIINLENSYEPKVLKENN